MMTWQARAWSFSDDTVLHIDEARGTNTDAVIGELRLSAFVLGGAARTAESVFDQARQNGLGAAENETVRVDGDALVCTLPCAFGTESTTWEFVADAPGYASTAQQVEARHQACTGSCPASCRDGTHVVVFLDES